MAAHTCLAADIYAINCGGGASGSFSADSATYANGGTKYTTTNPTIDTTGVPNAAPQDVYKTERYGASFSYVFPKLSTSPTTVYIVRLHFAEYMFNAPGKRYFNVTINGQTALSNYDVFAAAGGQYKAAVESFSTSADASGKITINFVKGTNSAEIKGIEILGQPKATLNEVSFGGSGYEPVTEDNGAATYDAPHWQDNSSPSNGDANDSSDHHYPVCFVRNSTMSLSAKLTLDPAPSPSGTYLIRGQELTGHYGVPQTPATLNGSNLTISSVPAANALPNTVGYFSPMQFTWQYSDDNGKTWYDAGDSDNRVYVTSGSPVSGATLYETVLETACKSAQGKATDADVVAGIWSAFASRSIKRKAVDGHNVPDGTLMTYWLPAATDCQTLAGMLTGKDGEGSCVAWSQFLDDAIKAQGIIGSNIYEVTPNTNINPGADSFLVKNWIYGSIIRAGQDGYCHTESRGDDVQKIQLGQQCGVGAICITPGPNGILDTTPQSDDYASDGTYLGSLYPYLMYQSSFGPFGGTDGDVADQLGIAGQSNPDPPGVFLNHFVVEYYKIVYDPSYGAGPFNSEAEHENAAIDGIGNHRTAKKNNPAVQELTYTLAN